MKQTAHLTLKWVDESNKEQNMVLWDGDLTSLKILQERKVQPLPEDPTQLGAGWGETGHSLEIRIENIHPPLKFRLGEGDN